MLGPGSRIGKYTLEERLGKGAFGVVHAAHDTELGREVAIKLLKPEFLARPQIAQRFLQEARAAAKIGHPGIVTVFDAGAADDGTAYIAMELLRGESLAQRGKTSIATAIELGRQLAATLHAAHVAGIVHRDLKPDNIYLIPDAAVVGGVRVKLLDFGVAKLAENLDPSVHTDSAMLLGTPRYMSPEQCRSAARVDHRSDIYMLGCIVFEMLCGKTPFDGDIGDMILQHRQVAPPRVRSLLPECPPELDALVDAMLAKAAGDRPATMQEVAEALTACLAEESETTTLSSPNLAKVETPLPTPTSLTTGATTTVRPAPSRRLLYALVIGLAAAVAITAILLARATPEEGDTVALPLPRPAIPTPRVIAAPPPPPQANDPRPQILLACQEARARQRWADLAACAVELEPHDADTARELRVAAKREQQSELVSADLTTALAQHDLAQAARDLAAIPEDSVYRVDARRRFDAAQAAEKPEKRAVAVAPPTPKKPVDPASCETLNVDETMKQAQNYFTATYARAAELLMQRALRCRQDTRMYRLAAVYACRAHDADGARKYYAQLPAQFQPAIEQACEQEGIKL